MSDRRVLIVRVGAMGDVLHALPAVAALRQAWPAAEIDWVVDPRWAPLLVDAAGRGPVVTRVYGAETRLWSRAPFSAATRRSVLGLRSAMRKRPYSWVVDMQGTLRSAVLGRFARTEHALTGYADPRETPARWLYGQTVPRSGTHVVTQGAMLLGEALGMPLEPAIAEIPLRTDAERWADAACGDQDVDARIALLAPTAGWGAKQWPAARFAALARALRDRGFQVLVNTGETPGSVEREVVRESAGAATLAPCSVAQMIALTRRAAVVVGGDSGPIHLAALLGRPVVALFGPTDPARNGPWGAGRTICLRHPASHTSYKRIADTDPGLAQIGVDEALEAVSTVTSP